MSVQHELAACGASAPSPKPRRTIKRHTVGYKHPLYPDDTQLTIRVEDELFAAIKARAHRDNVTVTEEIRMLLEWGLDAAQQEAA